MELMSLPQKINAMRVVTYDVNDELIGDLMELHECSKEELTIENLIDYVGDWAIEDLASVHKGTIFQDQDGNTLQEWES
jgi:hypothetical protein